MRKDFRDLVRSELAKNIQNVPIASIIKTYDSPVLVLDSSKISEQYTMLRRALPMVDHHFAIKALRHPAAVAAVDECGGFFDVMTNSDIDLIKEREIAPERCIQTNPIKKPSDISRAFNSGLRTFVVDNYAEVDKFVPYAGQVRLLVRLSFRNPEAKSDLSFKFGIAPDEAERLVAYARGRGIEVAGFSLHVGSQIHSAQAYIDALKRATELIDKVEEEQNFTMTLFDMGGGFPVSYREPAPALAEIALAVAPILKPLSERMRLLSEPGRFIVAPAMTLICQVVGKSVRNGKQWYYLDDGLYGSYSNVIFEQVTPPILALKELETESEIPLRPAALGGPTCDSVDVISTDCQLPELEVGDRIISPMMGAYTWVSATEFNGIPRTPIIELNSASHPEIAETISSAARQPDSMAPSM